ncbi:MAG: hypothetical protein LCH60_07040 [Actinobacteria bacterium]|nr:hypothetical protein [Actinomycetota bacterium]
MSTTTRTRGQVRVTIKGDLTTTIQRYRPSGPFKGWEQVARFYTPRTAVHMLEGGRYEDWATFVSEVYTAHLAKVVARRLAIATQPTGQESRP